MLLKGDLRQERAINIDAVLAQGKYLLTLDDDSSSPDPQTFGRLAAVMDANLDTGMTGGGRKFLLPFLNAGILLLEIALDPWLDWLSGKFLTSTNLGILCRKNNEEVR